ncbi:DHH family phosphoesterase [Candidatus Woesearchaeota archaeon]|nr:DHH family phosphoesterase [Candidatus Woesearchaeota archaeon]
MDNHVYFQELLEKAASFYKSIEADKVIRIIAHLDADGIASCGIFSRFLLAEKRKFVVSFVHDLRQEFLQKVGAEHYNYYLFLDLGSANLSGLEKKLPNKKILVIDHCYADKQVVVENEAGDAASAGNIVQVNPYLVGIDGSKEISSAGMVYLLCAKINYGSMDEAVINSLGVLTLIGAIGDCQDSGGFTGINKILLDNAIEKNSITKSQGLTIITDMNQPVHKMLEYSISQVLPGITGSEAESFNFLAGLGINPKHDNSWKVCAHLAEEDISKIKAALQNKFMDKSFISNLYGDNYHLTSNFALFGNNLREISAIIKACGRMGNAQLGLRLFIGLGSLNNMVSVGDNATSNLASLAKKCSVEYRNKLLAALSWYVKNKDSPNVMKGNGYFIVNLTSIRDFNANLLGKAIEIISISGEVQANTLVLGLAVENNFNVKVSLRYLGQDKESAPKLDRILKEITEQINGEILGHRHVMGALIPREKEMDFIKIARKVLESRAMEEIIR